jgi:hypothetical protein
MSRGTDSRSTGSFVRGMTIGALLGAVVAGSSLWSRRRLARRTAANEAAQLALPPPAATETPTAPDGTDAPEASGPESAGSP